MSGLLGSLEIASSSLLAARAGIETAGVNISNVNNPSYARQRLLVEPRSGSGVAVLGNKSLRDSILDEQLIREASNKSYLENFQRTLQIGQSMLGQQIDRQSATPEADSAARRAHCELGVGDVRVRRRSADDLAAAIGSAL